MQIGWSIDSEYEKIMAAQGSSPGEKKRIGHAIKQMREQKELLEKFRELENNKMNPSIKKFFEKAKSFWKN